jgi:flavin reductase (DIM6/NTAB) family NADH-FMN oxidoreductase RutF
MEYDPTQHDARETYRLLTSSIIPRPIGFISSRSRTGVDNLAPYSYFNAVSSSPPVILFSAGDRDGELKDTPRNILEREEFVFNLVTEDIGEQMDRTSALLDADESEFDFAGLQRTESTHVTVPRVVEASVALECTLHDSFEVYDNTVILGEVVYAHVDDELVTDGKIDVTKIDAVGRLAGPYYSGIDKLELERSY